MIYDDAPGATYRVQVRAEFGFAEVAGLAEYLAALGVSHVYLSPVLQATPGSAHGYDVVDHTRLSAEAGGEAGFAELHRALQAHGLRAVADVVPNHMAVPTPARLNAPLWDVLAQGRDSAFAHWFDVDWSPYPGRSHGQLLMPVLGGPVGDVVADGELTVDASAAGGPVLRYYEHEFPLRKGTSELPMAELLDAQWYRPAWWRVGGEELNYRRFFDVTSLIAVRVEEPDVFDATHALIARLVAEGGLSGLRIDHPDGLADPAGYLRRLQAATGGAWVVVEKILEGDEALPEGWACAGTTGYDALNAVQGVFVDPDGEGTLTRLAEPEGVDEDYLDQMVENAKFTALDMVLQPELDRLLTLLVRICATDLELRDHTRSSLQQALSHLLVAMDRYRAYAEPGEPAPIESQRVLDMAVARAAAALDAAGGWQLGEQTLAALRAIREIALDSASADPLRREFCTRFQQTCGPVMAKGIEDTLFYRTTRLLALNEVGADPHRFSFSPEEFHEFADRLQRDWPQTMTTLSTHDTKRSEDARARLLTLSEMPGEWARAVLEWEDLAERHLDDGWPAGQTRYLLWQTLVAIWGEAGPPSPDRVLAYLEKAVREAKVWTSWTAPNEGYEASTAAFAGGVLADLDLVASIGGFVERLAPADRVNVLGQKLVQLTMPGVPDVYQGCEAVDRSLVDPDNRRPVDYAFRREVLTRLDDGVRPDAFDPADRLDAEKLLVTSRALRLRRDLPRTFGPSTGAAGGYVPVPTGSEHLFAFARGGDTLESCTVLSVVTRLHVGLMASGGWDDSPLTLPPGTWTDVLTGREWSVEAPVVLLLADLPVALLVRD
ncbi:malto-oligosyltrehalose synthase [Spongisporangium articulatum]|uniref:Malto-oligosyltrehalose synthase n=1 Tax=Spongisporangium articulatum TaxID=3362603 RepID=A0ABW8AS34_9ACTN